MVKCAECGFLTIRHSESRRLDEVGGDVRESGKVPWSAEQYSQRLYDQIPICFAMASDLRGEAEDGDPENFLRVIQDDRECSSFETWRQGYTPKEHQERLDRESLRAQERESRMWLVLVAGAFTLLGVLMPTTAEVVNEAVLGLLGK